MRQGSKGILKDLEQQDYVLGKDPILEDLIVFPNEDWTAVHFGEEIHRS